MAMDLWAHPASSAALGLAALLVNVRHVLMGASLGTKLDRFPSHGKYLGALVMADENWAMAEARARRMPLTPAYYAGLSVLFYLNWIASTLVGALLGALLGDPAALGLDFVFTALFVVLVTRFWRGAETGLVLMASGLAAIVAHKFLPGAWYIPAGALAGVLALLATDLLRRKSAP